MNTLVLPKTQHLVVFQEVIRSGSISSAAKSLGLTQPAVSKIISDVEAYFGVELIVRKNTGVTLTEAGQVLLSWSESITREITKPSSLHSCRPCATGGWTLLSVRSVMKCSYRICMSSRCLNQSLSW